MKQTILFLSTAFTLLNAATLNHLPSSNSLIVYNSNMGLVHEERNLVLKQNDTEIVFKGVARTIDIDSVNVSLPKGVTLYSQQYRYDKLTQQKLLEAHLGKIVVVKGAKVTLLSHSATQCIVKTIKNKIITVESKDIVFNCIPKSLLTKPSLVWNVKTDKNINTNIKLDYVIKNISWHSNYILNLDKNRANLNAWISINNDAGKAFKETSLYLLAGDVNRVDKRPNHSQMRYMKTVMADSPAVAEQAHEGYHFYTITFKVNLKNHEKTQIKFIEKNGLVVKREYSVRVADPLYLRGERKSNVMQYVTLKGLDVALPKGVVRTYSKLGNTSILLGESRLKHTPKNTPIRLKLGQNFDLKVIQTVTSRNDYKHLFNTNIKYAVKNASDEDKTVEILVPFNSGEDSIVKTKQKYIFSKGNLVTFSVRVKANTTETFNVYFESKKFISK